MSFTVKRIERSIEKKLLYIMKKRQWCRSSKKRLQYLSDGGTMTEEQIYEVKSYFKPFVPLQNTIDHEFYTACTGIFHVEYIPDWVHYSLIDPYFNNWEAAKLVDNKCYYQMMFPNCTQPYAVLYRMNGIWFNHERQPIQDCEISKIIENEISPLFVKKASESCGGHGVIRCFGIEEIVNAISGFSGDLIVQRELQQSEVTSRLNPTSVNTIRILSVLSEFGVKVYSMIFRCGIGGAFVDNASSGGITIGIEKDGRLKSIAYDKNGQKFSKHPTTNICFSEIVIPNIRACIDLIKRLHPFVPNFRMVSWDIALDVDDNPVLIEANLKEGELDFHQLNNGPLFGEDTSAILHEVFLDNNLSL